MTAEGSGATGALDATAVEALIVDRYLDELLAASERRAVDAPCDATLDPSLRAAAVRLRDELVRVHPSFRFQERLARRLAEQAAAMRRQAQVGQATAPDADPVPLTGRSGRHLAPEAGAALGVAATVVHDDEWAADPAHAGLARPLLLGGAVTSAALSLAGAAFLAWRVARGTADDPMVRAVRAARAVRGSLPRGFA